MNNQLAMQLYQENKRDESQVYDTKAGMILTALQQERKELKGLKDIQNHNRAVKAQKTMKKKDISNPLSNGSSASTFKRMRAFKDKTFDNLLKQQTMDPINSKSYQLLAKRNMQSGGLDVHEDFVSDASDDQ